MKVLIAVDGSDEAEQAVVFADRLVPADAEVLLLDVVEPERPLLVTGHGTGLGHPTDALPAIEQERVAAADDDLLDAAARMAWRDPDTLVDHGLVARHIVDLAAEQGCDLVVVGTRDAGLLTRLFDPSVARDVIDHAPCSVLVVR